MSSRRGLDGVVAALGAADVERADPALVVGRDRHGLEHARDLVVGEAVLAEALLRAVHDELLRARAGGHALGLDADQPARAAVGSPPPSRTACRSPGSREPEAGVSLCSG